MIRGPSEPGRREFRSRRTTANYVRRYRQGACYRAKENGAQLASVNISQGRARTAARYRRETRLFYNAYETGHMYVSTLDATLVASPGGWPLVKLIGANGCSGGTGDQDAAACEAGADLVK